MDPIFLMGNHRSGTTWLHELLAETGCFAYVSAFHVIAYDGLDTEPPDIIQSPTYHALVDTFGRLGLDRRTIDEVSVSPSSPEEYGSILGNLGGNVRIRPRNLALFHQLCERVRRTSGPARPLILKNPWDYPNFLYIKSAISTARFVFIHRHPERVIHSSLNATRSVLASRDPYYALLLRDYDRLFTRPALLAFFRLLTTRHFGLGVHVATDHVARANSYYMANVRKLPPTDYLSIRYEDLCRWTPGLLDQTLRFCGVDPALARPLRTQPRPRSGRLLPEVSRHSGAIARRMVGYMRLHGYRAGDRVLPVGAGDGPGAAESQVC